MLFINLATTGLAPNSIPPILTMVDDAERAVFYVE